MPKYVIERAVPGAGELSASELHDLSCASNAVLAEMSGRAQWMHSYVTADKLYCVYIADDVDAVREHATRGGFPADSIAEIRVVIDPATGGPGNSAASPASTPTPTPTPGQG
jgi:hypothetical protein